MSKMEKDHSSTSFLTRPAFIYIISFTLLMLNLVAIYYNTNKETDDITNLATNASPNMFNYSEGNTNNNFFLTATNNNY